MPTSTVKPTKRSRRLPERSKGTKGDFEGLGVDSRRCRSSYGEEEDRNAEESLKIARRAYEDSGRPKSTGRGSCDMLPCGPEPWEGKPTLRFASYGLQV
jgi:hypothetical protein